MSAGGGRIGEVLSFPLDQDFYALEVAELREVNRDLIWTPIPGAPHYVRGAANLRGTIVTVVDLRRVLGYLERPRDLPPCLLIVAYGGELLGVLVDEVGDVLPLEAEKLQPVPGNLAPGRARFLRGVIQQRTKMVAMLELERILFPDGSIQD